MILRFSFAIVVSPGVNPFFLSFFAITDLGEWGVEGLYRFFITGQRGKRCKGSNSNSNRVAKELGVEEEAVDDQKKRSIGIEGFPVQVIGNILSRFDDVTDVVRASWTCKKWRAALHHHLHTLQHEYIVDDYQLISELSDRKPQTNSELECLLTDTILQTSSLLNLRIAHEIKFSATTVITWPFAYW